MVARQYVVVSPTGGTTVVDHVTRLVEAQALAAAVRPRVGGFPYLAEALRQAGIERHRYVVPAGLGVFSSGVGTAVQQSIPIVSGVESTARWDVSALVAALRADQAGRTSFPRFAEACWEAGVLEFEVDLIARTCTYRGSGADDVLVEHYSAVDLPAVTTD
jgi:uncharacterized protein YbcV (DUF1398 family)